MPAYGALCSRKDAQMDVSREGPGHLWSGLEVDVCGLASQLQSQPGARRVAPPRLGGGVT